MTQSSRHALWLISALFLSSQIAQASHQATPASSRDGRRLIQTGEAPPVWMTPTEIESLARATHEAGKCGGFMDVTEHSRTRVQPMKSFMDFGTRKIQQSAVVTPLLQELSAQNIHDAVVALSAFQNRHYQSPTGESAADWIYNQFVALSAGRTDIQVSKFKHSFRQPSIIARIQGRGPHADQTVVVGAHEDSVNWSSGGQVSARLAPGADDDASGIATLLETFRVLAHSGYSPDRSIEFMAYAAEEAGLLGSQDIAQNYLGKSREVAAVFQMDMTMYPGSGNEIVMISDHVHHDLTKFTEGLIDAYVKMPWSEDTCGYGCSDHASWDRAGYPSVFPFEASFHSYNHKIHTDEDRLELLDWTFGLHFSKLATAFAVELSQGD